MKQKTVYLDYAATTPLDAAVEREMARFGRTAFGNPGSLHSYGQAAIAGIDAARERITKSIGAQFGDLIFTGSATEANNLALRGTVEKCSRDYFAKHGKNASRRVVPHIIVSAIEHESILETVCDIERRGAARITLLPVDQEGIVSLPALEKALTPETILVSVMYVNNEVGTIQPIRGIAEHIHEYKARHANHSYPLFHTDAVQAFQYLDCNVTTLGVDLMTLSSHKMYGPKGMGALYLRDKKEISPLITGGGQEFGLRSGTENVAGIVGFGKATELAMKSRDKEGRRLTALREYAFARFEKLLPAQILINGSRTERIPNNINIYCKGKEAEELVVRLDRKGIAISAGPACAARTGTPSAVLRAMGFPEERIRGSVRITLGRQTTKQDIDLLLRNFLTLYNLDKKESGT